MTSSVDICNLALAYLGQEPIMTLDDESKASRLCKQFYDSCRHSMLRLAPWSFALKRTVLAQEADTGLFRIPVDCLRVVEVYTPVYLIKQNYIEASETSLEILYVQDIEVVTEMDVLFRELLALKIAKDICISLTADMNLAQLMDNKFREKEADARHTMSGEQFPQMLDESPWIVARY